MFYVSMTLGIIFIIGLTLIGIVKFIKKLYSGEIQKKIAENAEKVTDKIIDGVLKKRGGYNFSNNYYDENEIICDPAYSDIPGNIYHFDD